LETYRIIFLVVYFRQIEEKPFIRQAFDLLLAGLDSKHKPISSISLGGLLIITSSCHHYNKQLIEKGHLMEQLVGWIHTSGDKKMKKICLSILANISKE